MAPNFPKKKTAKKKARPVKKTPKRTSAEVQAGREKRRRELRYKATSKTAGQFVFVDQRHVPQAHTEEKHQFFEVLRAGNMFARINHKDIHTAATAITRRLADKNYSPVEKRAYYRDSIKRLAGKYRFDPDNYPDTQSPKNFTSLVKLLEEKIPYGEPNRHLSDFSHITANRG